MKLKNNYTFDWGGAEEEICFPGASVSGTDF